MTEGGLSGSDIHRILDAVDTIETSLGVLARKATMDRETYLSDPETRDIVERRFVKMTEAAIDIGTVLVKHERGEPPSSNPETMYVLGDRGVLTETTASEMAKAARFRNVLAHTYGNVLDHDVVYNALQDLARYRTFLMEVRVCFDEIDGFDE